MPLTDDMRVWIDDELARLGIGPVWRVDVARDMPWAVVASVVAGDRQLWFKANHDAFAYEAPVLDLLDRAAPGTVLAPMAFDQNTGWFLARDGGTVSTPETTAAAEIVQLYVRLQLASIPVVDELASVGVPDRTGVEILEVFDRLIGDPAATEFARRAQRHRPLVEDLVAVLGSDERRCLTNGDVKHEHAFIGPPLRLFDFGDCLITHPFVSLDRVARLADHHAGAVDLQAIVLAAWDTTPDDPSIPPARMASALLGAEIWLRDPPGAREMFPDAIPRWLGRFCDLMDDLSR